MWYLGIITSGIESVESFATGRHVRFRRLPDGTVDILAAKNATAVVSEVVAARHIQTVRDANGNPVRVRSENQRWFKCRGNRPCPGRPGRLTRTQPHAAQHAA